MAVVYNHWTGLDWWTITGLLDSQVFFLVFKHGSLDSVEWNGGLEWNGEMERYFGNFNWWSPLYKDHLLTKITSL